MKHRIPLIHAQRIATAIVEALAPTCQRIEIAGSVRRGEPECGDIEIVAIPKTVVPDGMFPYAADRRNLLRERLDFLVDAGRLQFVKGGEKYRQYIITKSTPLALDLFIVTASTWGVQLAIRTGPAEFSHRLVTNEPWGLLPARHRVEGGRIWDLDANVPMETPEEADVIEFCCGEWVPPEARRTWCAGVKT
jgi:DNA polymerase/3'-5' exonuclease PolX